jgi:hypothetical protein
VPSLTRSLTAETSRPMEYWIRPGIQSSLGAIRWIKLTTLLGVKANRVYNLYVEQRKQS